MNFTEKPKSESSAEHLEMVAIDHTQRELMRRYLEKNLGENYAASEKKLEYELRWVKEQAPIFRAIFNANKDEFLKMYKEDKKMLTDAVEEALEDPL